MYLDTLTGVYNKRYLKEVQRETITEFINNKIPFSMVWIDIDHFKEINDTHGHMTGDEIIKGFARFLIRQLRESDTVIRYGGDEFICIMPRTTRRDAECIYHCILAHCRQTEFSGLYITLSAGIAAYPDDGNDYDRLLKTADQADSRLHAALMLYETLGDWLATGRAHYHIGVAELKKGNKEQYKEHAQKALDIFKFIKTKSWKEKAEAIIKECASV